MKKRLSWHQRYGLGLEQDIRLAVRSLVKRPMFTAGAALALALGVGTCTVIFSAVNAILLRPLPYKDSDRIISIHGRFMLLKMENLGAGPREFQDYREMNHVFDEMAAFRVSDFAITGGEHAERVRGAYVSSELFDLLGAHQQVGRLFQREEHLAGRNNVAVISDGLWNERYARDSGIVGSEIALNGASYMIVGVMPRGFRFQYLTRDSSDPLDVWLPLAFSQQDFDRGWFLNVIGRLKSGVTIEQARADIGLIASGFLERYPQRYRGPHGEDGGWSATPVPVKYEQVGNVKASLLVLLGAVAMLLLIACANVANLLLVRGLERKSEIAIRSALGAARRRIFRQLLIESFILATISGVAGFTLAFWGRDLLVAFGARSIPRVEEVNLDGHVLGFALLLCCVTTLVFGLVPAIRLSNVDLTGSLKQGGRSAGSGHNRLRSLLVAGEVALSLVLLVSAGLLMKCYVRLRNTSLGFNPTGVLAARVDLVDSKYPGGREQSRFFQELLDGLNVARRIESATVFSGRLRDPFSIEGQPFDSSNPSTAFHLSIGPGYFHTLQIPVARGREFTDADSPGSPGVAIIDKTLADRFFVGEDPIGRQIKLGVPGYGPWLTIVGVAGDVRDGGPASAPEPTLYLAYAQMPVSSTTLAVRFSGGLGPASAVVRDQVAAVDKDQPVYRIETLDERLALTISEPRLDALLLSAFSVVALIMTVVGLYGMIAYSVSQRINEIGIRMAVGANQSDIAQLVVMQGLGLTLAGAAAGMIGAMISARLLSGLLFNVSNTDPWTFISVPLILVATAFLACFGPALRASRLDPVRLLRQE